jgi:hypothetical protein
MLILAERLRREGHRLDPPRVFVLCRRLQRAPSAAGCSRPILSTTTVRGPIYHWKRTERTPEPSARGRVIVLPQVGGLHRRYQRLAA